MQCLRCGREFDGKVALCPACFNQGRLSTVENLHKREEELRSGRLNRSILVPGVSWYRLFAWMIDLSLVALFLRVVFIVFASSENALGFFIQSVLTDSREDLPDLQLWGIGTLLLMWAILTYLVGWIYFSYLEASPRQATLGKRMFGLVVTDLDNLRISFPRATLRYLCKGFWILPLAFGIAVLPFVTAPQFAGQIVGICFALGLFIWLVTFGLILVSEESQGLHDYLSACLVQRDLAVPFSRIIWGIGMAILLPACVLFLTGENSPGLKLEEQWSRFRRGEIRTGVQTLPYNTRQNPSLKDPTASERTVDIPTSPEIKATVNGRTVRFERSLALYDLRSGIIEVGFYAEELSEQEIQAIRRSATLKSANGPRPELAITMQFPPGERRCDIKHLQGYAVSFNRGTGRFSFDGPSALMEFSRLQTWLNSDEIMGLSCTLCDPSEEGCTGGTFAGIFRDEERAGGVGRPRGGFSWDLAFRTRALPKMATKVE